MQTLRGLHTHALTGRVFAWLGQYEVEGTEVRWQAWIERDGRPVDRIEGRTVFNSADMTADKAVTVGVRSRIDAADYDDL